MTSSYDEEIFERGQWSITLPQRLRHALPKFRGTFNLAIQSVSTNFLQRTSSFYMSHFLFYNFMLFSIVFGILLLYELVSRRRRRHEDRDLFDVIRKIVRQDSVGALYVVIIVFMLGELIYISMKSNIELMGSLVVFALFVLWNIITLVIKVPW